MRHRHRRPRGAVATVALCVAAAVTISGCGLFERSDPRVHGASVTSPAVTVTLLDAGAEPRRPVRFTLTAGTSVALEISLDLHLTQRTVDSESPQVLDPPVTRQTVELTVESVDDRGADVTFEIVDAGIDPADDGLTDAQILQLTASVQAVLGLRGDMRVDRTGRVLALSYQGAASLPPEVAGQLQELESSLTGLVPVLPVEPIGRGARWRTVTDSVASGLRVRQSTDYEVTSIDDGRLTYRATISQGAPEQDLEAGDLSVRLLAADVVGTTNGMVSTVDLATESDTELHGSQVIEQDGGQGPDQRVTQELTAHVSVAPVDQPTEAGA